MRRNDIVVVKPEVYEKYRLKGILKTEQLLVTHVYTTGRLKLVRNYHPHHEVIDGILKGHPSEDFELFEDPSELIDLYYFSR